MKIRGERECKDCGARWSYYETESVVCPDCGSLHSVGVADRQLHTASPVELDLTAARADLGSEPLGIVARRASETAAAFVREHGFVHAGELQPLDAPFVAATELWHAGAELARSLRIDDVEEAYLLALLDGAESGQRPSPDDIPESMAAVRGLAAASSVADYHRDVRRYLADNPDADARRILGRIEDHRTRVEALDGAVPPEMADALVEGVQAVGTYLIEDSATLEAARERLDELDLDGP
ncbi:DUF7117 family protein [Halorhabdus amylolytica]|uniref:DUF7117 family protein n=1 Tax=Halorhabdus amylolytica TaxID=2559573 RepID=UPI0010AA1D4D|nr:TFIIB-type zinc ribbon-containing protein [Halorhabdus amylolytica]